MPKLNVWTWEHSNLTERRITDGLVRKEVPALVNVNVPSLLFLHVLLSDALKNAFSNDRKWCLCQSCTSPPLSSATTRIRLRKREPLLLSLRGDCAALISASRPNTSIQLVPLLAWNHTCSPRRSLFLPFVYRSRSGLDVTGTKICSCCSNDWPCVPDPARFTITPCD